MIVETTILVCTYLRVATASVRIDNKNLLHLEIININTQHMLMEKCSDIASCQLNLHLIEI